MSAVNRAFDDAMHSLQLRYAEKLIAAVSELQKFAIACDLDGVTPDMRDAVLGLAHRLSGNGQILGFPAISAAAADLESALAKDKTLLPQAATLALVKACKSAMGEIASTQVAPRKEVTTEDAPANRCCSDEKKIQTGLPTIVAAHCDNEQQILLKTMFVDRAKIVTVSKASDLDLSVQAADLVVVDLDGADAAEAIRSIHAQTAKFRTPVLTLTAHRKTAAIARALDGEIAAHVLKPVDPSELYKKIRGLLARGRRLVIVGEDDRVVRELLRIRFEASGFEVILANDGEEAVALAKDRHPSIIVLDRAMPKLEGLVALKMLKNDATTCEIPVIMLTSRAQPHEISEGRKAGAADYLLKPFTPQAVVAKALEILSR